MTQNVYKSHQMPDLSRSRLLMKQYDNLVKWNDRFHFNSTKPTLHIVQMYVSMFHKVKHQLWWLNMQIIRLSNKHIKEHDKT